MGAFCVFGVSRSHCRKQAEKVVPTVKFIDRKRIDLTASEWGGIVAIEAENLYATSEKVVRISPELDAPQFCRDWIEASPGEVKLTKIMYRGPKIDKHGAVVMRLGAPVLTWLEYDDSMAFKAPTHPPQFAFEQAA